MRRWWVDGGCVYAFIPFVSHGVVPRRQLSSQSPPTCDKKVRLLVRWVGCCSSVSFRRGVMMPPRLGCRKRQEVGVVLVVVIAAARSQEEEDETQAAAPATCPQVGML